MTPRLHSDRFLLAAELPGDSTGGKPLSHELSCHRDGGSCIYAQRLKWTVGFALMAAQRIVELLLCVSQSTG